jgi:hypothetical protein
MAQGLFRLNLKYGSFVLDVDNTGPLALKINCRLPISRLVVVGFSYKLESNENHSKHYVFSLRHEILFV